MTRRTILLLAGAPAFGQYILPPQAPPATRFPPSPEEAAEITRKLAQLQERLAELRQRNVPDESLVEVEIYHKAAAWIGRFSEYFTKASVNQTIALLDAGLARAKELAAGNAPWKTATGPVIRAYRSRLDGSIQPYLAHVPSSYSGRQPLRLDVILHGTNRGMVEVQFMSHTDINLGGQRPAPVDYLQIEVLGRTNNAYRWAGEADVMESIQATQRSYAVDENRIVLRGFSMGGAGTWHLGLHHPDHWAAIEAGAGFTDTIKYAHMNNLPGYQLKTLHVYDSKDYALNVFQLPTVGYGGEIDPQQAGMNNIRAELEEAGFKFTHEGLNWNSQDLRLNFLVGPKTPHRWEPESKKRSDALMDGYAAKGREEPDHIRFVTYTTRFNRCFWVSVDGLEHHFQKAEVEARRSKADGTIQVKTTNVSSLVLRAGGVKKIAIDAQNFNSDGGAEQRFYKRAGAWQKGEPASLRKRHGLQGPIDDAFLESFLCVRPTRSAANDLPGRYADETLGAFADDFAKYFRGDVRVKDDTSVTAEDIADHHLIVFGDAAANQVLGRVLGKLQLRWNERQLVVGGKTYDAATHTVAMIYPNPLNPRRYVVLNSGHTFHRADMAATNAALFPRFGDYAVLRLRQPINAQVESEIVTAGYFDEEWKLA